jgi:outer membrane cobalamin receptor
LTPSAGLRRHFHGVYDDDWAPGSSVSLAKGEAFEIFANASKAVHYPGIYTRAVAGDFARNVLDAETMEYYSFGSRFEITKEFESLLTFYHSSVDDRIDKTATGYVNSGSMRAYGAEASSHWHVSEDFAVFGGAMFSCPQTHPVSRMPRWIFTLAEQWKVCEYLKWSVDCQYLGSMNAYSVRAQADRDELNKIGNGFIFNTRFALPLESFMPLKGEIYLSVENLTCEDYEYYPGYPICSAMWYLGCIVKF